MAGLAIITEACIDVKDRACVDVCPVQCIYEFDPAEERARSPRRRRAAGSSRTRTHRIPRRSRIFGDSILYVNLEECTSCTACYQPDVCPVGAIYSEEHLSGRLGDEREVQRRGSQQGPRPHVLLAAQPRRLRGSGRGRWADLGRTNLQLKWFAAMEHLQRVTDHQLVTD